MKAAKEKIIMCEYKYLFFTRKNLSLNVVLSECECEILGGNCGFLYANQLWKISYLLYEMAPSLFAFVKHLYTCGNPTTLPPLWPSAERL